MSELARLFLQYDYPETKDLCKHFLTVVTAVLVFSLAFSEKIVHFPTASRMAKRLLLSSWCSMISAIILCGIGLCYISVAAGDAVYGGVQYFDLAVVAWRWIVVAGVCFVVGLAALMGAGIVSIHGRKDQPGVMFRDTASPAPTPGSSSSQGTDVSPEDAVGQREEARKA